MKNKCGQCNLVAKRSTVIRTTWQHCALLFFFLLLLFLLLLFYSVSSRFCFEQSHNNSNVYLKYLKTECYCGKVDEVASIWLRVVAQLSRPVMQLIWCALWMTMKCLCECMRVTICKTRILVHSMSQSGGGRECNKRNSDNLNSVQMYTKNCTVFLFFVVVNLMLTYGYFGNNYLWTDGVSRCWSSGDCQLCCGVFG